MPRILVAGTPLAVDTLRRVLGAEVELVVAHSLESAIEKLSVQPDLIVCSVRFNESRMFDLLNHLHAMPGKAKIPVICCRAIDKPLSAARDHAIRVAAEALGAIAFFDLH